MTRAKKEIRTYLRLIDEAYNKRTWHGTNLRGSLRGLTAKEASFRPGRGRHNIWEIALHAAYWKYIVRRRITGEKKGSFPVEGSNFFTRPAAGARWKADLRLLEATHRKLRDAVASLSDRDLRRTPAGSRFTNEMTVSGIANHDVYHAGQIQLIKRFLRR